VLSSKPWECHIVSWRRKLNTDLFGTFLDTPDLNQVDHLVHCCIGMRQRGAAALN